MPENKFNNQQAIDSNALRGEAGSLELNAMYEVDPIGSQIPVNKSYVMLRDTNKNFISLKAGGIILRSIGDMQFDVNKNFAFSVKGDTQYVYGGNKHEYVQGNHTFLPGDHSQKAKESSDKLHSTLKSIQEQKKQAFESAPPSEVPCATCSNKVNTERASATLTKILRTIKKYLIPFDSFDVEKVAKYLSMLVVPFMSTTTNLNLTGGESCGHPNCKNGVMKTNGNNYEAANKVAQEQITAQQEIITQHEQNISPNANVHHYSGGVHIKAGHTKNDIDRYAKGPGGPFQTRLGTSPVGKRNSSPGEFGVLQDGAMKEVLHDIGVDVTPGGDIYLDAGNDITLDAGSPGIQLRTPGPTSIQAGNVDIISNRADLVLASNQKTTLKGKNIHIDANDRSGDSGIQLDAKFTLAKGQLSVTGDFVSKGTGHFEGAVTAPLFIGKSTTYATEPASSCNPVSHHAIWNSMPPFTNGYQATVYNTYSEALFILNTAINGLDYILTLEWLYNAILKALNLTKLNLPLDNTGIPTGFAMTGYDYFTMTPITVTTPAGPGVVNPGFMPVWTFPHNHPDISGGHHHWYESIGMNTYDTVKGIQANRGNPSHVPTPAPAPTGHSPGPESIGDSCGGGGAAFINPQKNNTTANITARNAKYGIQGDDAFGGKNYVDAYAQFNPDGSITPAPTSSMENNCP